jgi:hypothetical protein
LFYIFKKIEYEKKFISEEGKELFKALIRKIYFSYAMATHASFARLAHYSREFSKASQIYFKKGFGKCVELGQFDKLSIFWCIQVWQVFDKTLASVSSLSSHQKFPTSAIFARTNICKIHLICDTR